MKNLALIRKFEKQYKKLVQDAIQMLDGSAHIFFKDGTELKVPASK